MKCLVFSFALTIGQLLPLQIQTHVAVYIRMIEVVSHIAGSQHQPVKVWLLIVPEVNRNGEIFLVSPFEPGNFVSRDGFDRHVPRQPLFLLT